jgi:hypothetical protein
VKPYFAPVHLAEKTRQSLAFSGVTATKPHEVGEGVSLGHGFEGRLRLTSNLKYLRPKVGFYFWTIKKWHN